MRFLLPLLLLAAVTSAGDLSHSIWICDQNAGKEIDLDALVEALADKEVVFFGETHLDEVTHELELALYEGLVARTGGKVVLSLEMFQRDVQGVLDDYLAGKLEESEFLMKSRAWSNYRTGYRRLIEAAKGHGLPVVAANTPSRLMRTVAMGGGQKAIDALSPEDRALLPEKLFPNTDAYWERFARTVRGHVRMLLGSTPEQKLTSSQSLWDNTMGESVVKALAAHPGHLVLHVNGGFHTAYREGVVTQVVHRRPETKYATVDAVPVEDLFSFDPFGGAERADHLVYVRSRTRGVSEGFHSVTWFPELRYQLFVPHGSAASGEPMPLLVWLPGDGLRAADGMTWWRLALGQQAAIAVVEAPYPQVEDDLAMGARWFWQERFREDIATLHGGLQRIVAYVRRNYEIDEKRVVVAGAGTGATVVASLALYRSDMVFSFVAASPARYSKLRTMALPAKGETQAGRSLRVLADGDDAEWWRKEAQDWNTTGLAVAVDAGAVEESVRGALGLEPRAVEEEEEKGTVLVLASDTPRARHWAQRLALRMGRTAVVTEGELRFFLGANPGWKVKPLAFSGEKLELPEGAEAPFNAAELAGGKALPMAAGPFGGTTVIYVPHEVGEEERAAWKQLETDNVIKKLSRFARLRVAFGADELTAVLGELSGGRRRSVLVVPAVFCADADAMRGFAEPTRPFRDRLDLAYLPGLGVRLYRLFDS